MYMGSLPMYGKSCHVYIYIYIGKLTMCENCSYTWDEFPCMGRVPIYGKISHIREVIPNMASLPQRED